jgi:hypothetical protein
MADATYRTTWEARTPPFGIQDLLRLAIWGTFAAAALALAVVSISSSGGFRRSAAAQPTPQAAAKTAADAAEAKRLVQAVNALTADREQILARLSALERGLNDVTGSIKKEAKPPASPDSAAVSPPPAPAASEAEAGPDSVNRSQTLTAAPPRATAATETAAVELGIDVGGAISFEGLRTLWSSTKHHLPALSEELYPVVAVKENSRGGAELRLIIGPMANPELATELCGKLAAAHHSCQAAAFQGQRLSLIEPLPKAHPAADPPPHHPAPGPRQP